MDSSFIFYLIAGLLVIVGIAGVILPALPGVPLVLAGLLLAAWGDGFHHVGWIALTGLGLLTRERHGDALLALVAEAVAGASADPPDRAIG